MKISKFVSHLPPTVENQYPFKEGEEVLFLGEIDNRPGTCAVFQLTTRKIYVGFETNHFEDSPELSLTVTIDDSMVVQFENFTNL